MHTAICRLCPENNGEPLKVSCRKVARKLGVLGRPGLPCGEWISEENLGALRPIRRQLCVPGCKKT